MNNQQNIPFLFQLIGFPTQPLQQKYSLNPSSVEIIINAERRYLTDQNIFTVFRESFFFASDTLKGVDTIAKATLAIPVPEVQISDSVWSVVETASGQFFKVHAHKMESFA